MLKQRYFHSLKIIWVEKSLFQSFKFSEINNLAHFLRIIHKWRHSLTDDIVFARTLYLSH